MSADGIVLAIDSDTNETYVDIKGIQGTEDLIKKKPSKKHKLLLFMMV